MLLGAAQHLVEDGAFDGTVYFIFQPSEEDGRGALAMIDDGLFERFPMEAVYGMHNMPGIAAGRFAVRRGAIMTSEDIFGDYWSNQTQMRYFVDFLVNGRASKSKR